MDRRPVFVYFVQGTAEIMKQWMGTYIGTPLWYWVADASSLQVGKGQPNDLNDTGAVFNERGEIRWWRHNDGFDGLMILENPADRLSPLDGRWEMECHTVDLQNLAEPRVDPPFDIYPNRGIAGLLEVRVCQKSRITVLISPRRFL